MSFRVDGWDGQSASCWCDRFTRTQRDRDGLERRRCV